MRTDLDPRFVGVWWLRAVEDRDEEGRSIEPLDYGAAPKGIVIYLPGGLMAVQFMRRDRPLWKGLEPSEAEVASAARGYSAYVARWRVDAERPVVIHTV